ncbi:diguanylate cyclase domain-containing protein [Deinococcus oregonensis]|uniref:Diguanylate cyclase domain-containing protein n=1 Tax=Deinococcus oregonensis TaxID=1805970 RepID=A0ABV6AUZ4_9DEIO
MGISEAGSGADGRETSLRLAAALDAQGWAAVHAAPRQALALLEEALPLARTSSDQKILTTILRHLSYTHYTLGNFDPAHASATEAVAVARNLGEPFYIGASVNMLGIALRYRGELAGALEAQREHLRIAEELDHPEMRAHALNNIGSVHYDLGESQRASDYHQAAIELARELGDDIISLKARNNLGADLQRLGDGQAATAALMEALALARQLNVRSEEALALNSLAKIALEGEAFLAAQTLAADALEVSGQVGDLGMRAEAHLHSGLALLGLGDQGEAEQHLSTALKLSESACVHQTQVGALHALARSHEQRGSYPAAFQYLRQAHILDLQIHAATATRRTQALSALIEAEHYRREVTRERARSAELAAAIAKLQEAQAKQEELTLKLAYQATHDPLTGLVGRTLFRDRLEKALASSANLTAPLAVFFIDLNGFKLVNDTYGHATGDQLLQEVARRLTGAVFGRDSVARLGGDEFVVLATHLHPAVQAHAVAQKLLDVLVQPCQLGGAEIKIGAAIGVSVFPHDGTDATTLLRHADEAMYLAKRRGDSTVQFYRAVASVN